MAVKLRTRGVWWMGRLAVAAISLVLAVPAQANRPPLNDDLQVSELEAGASFESLNGAFTFSDFDFTAIGFDDSLFEECLVHPDNMGFRLILGFADPFGPGSLEMSYTVTANPGFGIGGVRIPFLGLLNPMGSDPLAAVELTTSNGVMLSGSTTDFTSWETIFEFFDPEESLRVSELVTLSGGKGTLKLDTDFKPVSGVPEPGTGLMLALGIGAWMALRRRASV